MKTRKKGMSPSAKAPPMRLKLALKTTQASFRLKIFTKKARALLVPEAPLTRRSSLRKI